MKNLFLSAALLCVSTSSALAVTYGVAEAGFAGLTREKFVGVTSFDPGTYNFGNGMVYNDISGGALINYNGSYGMGDNPSVNAGRDGGFDGYLGTNSTPASFSLNFAGGTNLFGFSGAESAVPGGSDGRNGILDLQFYDLSNVLIGTFALDTNVVFAWDQWHGFSSAQAIGKVVFNTIGHSVIDDVTFQGSGTSVPDSGSAFALLGLSLAGLIAFRRKVSA